MKRVLCILLPYVSAVVAILMQYVDFEYISIIEALVLGALIGIWFYCIGGCEGTRGMLVISVITLLLCVGVVGCGFFIELVEPYMYEAALWSGAELIGFYILMNNKPKQGMSYSYSYRNNKRRYF
ncbi:MAG: hypothetical protein LUH02_01945 [Erysipelotrichaceae bacterium]|nr:hypothetical protein [Erysipelotrichaceae bacterium]